MERATSKATSQQKQNTQHRSGARVRAAAWEAHQELRGAVNGAVRDARDGDEEHAQPQALTLDGSFAPPSPPASSSASATRIAL